MAGYGVGDRQTLNNNFVVGLSMRDRDMMTGCHFNYVLC